MTRRHRRQRVAERGTSSVELALILPIFLLFILGVVDLGQAVVLYNASSEAARDGARLGHVTVQPNPTVTAPPTMTPAQATVIASTARTSAGPLGGNLGVTSSAGIDARGPYVQVVVTTTYQPVARQFLPGATIPISAGSRIYLP
jgi:Flp pilus assembly protein TadG